MAPTLAGDHWWATCHECGATLRLPLRRPWMPAAGVRLPFPWRCFQCGRSNTVHADSARRPGDLVDIEPAWRPSAIRRGQWLAIRVDEKVMIKRVVALPGDVVSLDSHAGIRVNGIPAHQRIEFSARARERVHFDGLRSAQSRWHPRRGLITNGHNNGSIRPGIWSRQGASWRFERGRSEVATDPASWLLYHNEVDDRPELRSPVYDHWPENIGLRRRVWATADLEVVSTLWTSQACELESVFWTPGGCGRRAVVEVPGDSAGRTVADDPQTARGPSESRFWRIELSMPDEKVATKDPRQGSDKTTTLDVAATIAAGLTAETPVLLRFIRGEGVLYDLQVRRQIRYRLRPSDPRRAYPQTLGEGQFFVLGDNVPVSQDSRCFGAVSSSEILGVAKRAW